MKRQEFLQALKARLWALPERDIQQSLDYYNEMIDDRMEDGLSEEEAVAVIGDLDEIAEQILTEAPRPPQVVHPVVTEKKRLSIWLIVLLILGFPVWGSLAITIAAVVLSVWVTMWSVVVSLYATAFALGVSALGCVLGSFFMVGGVGTAMVAWGAALLCAGIAILLFLLSNLAAKGMVKLTKICWQGIKGIVTRKERSV